MSDCGCTNHSFVSQKHLMTGIKASGSVDPTGVLSLRAYAQMEGAMGAWIESLVLEAVIEATSQTHMTPASLYQLIGEILDRRRTELPKQLREYVEEQVRHGQRLGLEKIRATEEERQTEREVAREQALTVSRFTQGFNDTARSALEGIIRSHIKDGLTIDETTRGIQEWASKTGDLPRQAKWRAESIGRTESARAIVSGQIAAWKDSGVVQDVRWLISPQPCEFCLAVYRKFRQVQLGQNFLTTGQTLTGIRGGKMAIDYQDVKGPPLHPNCRCDLEPVVRGQRVLRANPSLYRDTRIG